MPKPTANIRDQNGKHFPVGAVAGEQPERFQHGEKAGHADADRRKHDMKRHREGELQPCEVECIEHVHKRQPLLVNIDRLAMGDKLPRPLTRRGKGSAGQAYLLLISDSVQ